MGFAMAGIAVYQMLAADKENKAIKQRERDQVGKNNAAIDSNTVNQYQQLSAVEVDIIDRGHEASLGEKVALMQAEANLEVQASAAGAGGRSFNLMMLDLKSTNGRNMNAIIDDTTVGLRNVDEQAKAIQRAAESGQITTSSIKGDGVSRGLGAVSVGLQGYVAGQRVGKAFGETRRPDKTSKHNRFEGSSSRASRVNF